MIETVDLRRSAYHDSVSLMQVSRAVAATPGVVAAQVAMATELNVEVLTGMGFAVPEEASANDLLVALRAKDDDALAAGLAAVADALADLRRGSGASEGRGAAPAPRTLGSAIRRGQANVVVISVPGAYAVTEAFDAIEAGASVMLFSDHVSVEDEIRLKDRAAAADVLVMGPDCGTALVGGVALGFANVVRRGTMGMVAASGTGAQQVMCLLDEAGVGVSHCLGVGGRDLKAAVGGRSTRQALRALAADPGTESIIVVSKPPDAAVLAEIDSVAQELGLRVHWALLGEGRPDLTASVEEALRAEGLEVPEWPAVLAPSSSSGHLMRESEAEFPHQVTTRRGAVGEVRAPGSGGSLRGLFCGGTLADEAMLIAAAELDAGGGADGGATVGSAGGGAGGGAGETPVYSNIAHRDELLLGPDLRSEGHVVIDFGDDHLTQGRAHPMIDPSLRMERIAAEAADPSCGVLLLDLVLGHGAHPDPAEELADAIRAARAHAATGSDDRPGRNLPVVVSLVGTGGDPQDRAATQVALAAAGASVFLSNAAATRHALSLLRSQS